MRAEREGRFLPRSSVNTQWRSLVGATDWEGGAREPPGTGGVLFFDLSVGCMDV